MLPVDLGVSGTVHSHPSGALHPSDADLKLFRGWGRRHIILGYPYGSGSWRAYDGNGRETTLSVIGFRAPTPADRPLPTYRPPGQVHREGEAVEVSDGPVPDNQE